MIEFERVSCRYHARKPIFENVSFHLPPKTVTVILGANGSGKTTLLRCMTRQIQPYEGFVKLNGKLLAKRSVREIARTIAYVPQGIEHETDFSVFDFIAFGRAPYLGLLDAPSKADYDKAYQYAEQNGIAALCGNKMNEISGGERQLVYITRALVQETPVIVMDEPMSALDLGNQAMILQIVSKLSQDGKTIVMTSHNPNHALAVSAQIVLIDREKRIRQGAAREILTNRRVLESAFGERVRCFETPERCYVSFSVDIP